MKRFSILTIVTVAIFSASPAFAIFGDEEVCNGSVNCAGDDFEDNAIAQQGQAQGQVGINKSTNTNKAFGGDAEQGQAQGIFDSGNSTAFGGAGGAGGDAHQGQLQGQIGINEQGQSQTGIVTGVNDQGQEQGQDQGQGQGQGQFGFVKTDVEIEGDTTTIDNDFPVNTAAPVFAGNCSQGVSGQTATWGASVASGNSVCDYIAVAGAFIAGGDRTEAFRVLGKAENAADWRFFFSRVRMVVTLGLL